MSKLNLDQYRTQAGWERDVQRVSDTDDVVEIKEVNEEEFQFGTPLKQTSLGPKGEELSTSVMIARENEQVTKYYQGKRVGNTIVPDIARYVAGRDNVQRGEQLDRTPVKTFDDRITLKLTANDGVPTDGWLEAKANQFKVDLEVAKGLMFEPNSEAQVTFMNKSVKTAVAADDAELLGSAAVTIENIAAGNMNIGQLLQQRLVRLSYTKDVNGNAKADRNQIQITALDLVFAQKQQTLIGGKQLEPTATKVIDKATMETMGIKAEKVPVRGDVDGQEIRLNLSKGFIKAEDPASVDGWRMVVGFTDHEGKWHNCGEAKVGKQSKAEKFKMILTDADKAHQQNRALEIRVYNDAGVPAERFNIPFREIDWSPSLRARGGQQQD